MSDTLKYSKVFLDDLLFTSIVSLILCLLYAFASILLHCQ